MNNSSKGGLGFCGVLAIVFIVLKLAGVVSWPWLWVLSPIWIPLVLIVIAAICGTLLIKWINK